MLLFSMVLRKGEVEACPWAVIGGSPYAAAVVLKDGTANGESHTHTGGLGGVERIEDPP